MSKFADRGLNWSMVAYAAYRGHPGAVNRALRRLKGVDIDAEYKLITEGISQLSAVSRGLVVALYEGAYDGAGDE